MANDAFDNARADKAILRRLAREEEYAARVEEAKGDIRKALGRHGITVVLDALVEIAQEVATIPDDTEVKAIWSDLASALRALTHGTAKLSGLDLSGRGLRKPRG